MTVEELELAPAENDNEFGEKALELRRELKLYAPIQKEVIKRMLGVDGNFKDHFESWVELYSPEFEEAYLETVEKRLKEDPEFLDKLQRKDDMTIQEIEERVRVLHRLEVMLLEDIKKTNHISQSFSSWHSTSYKDVLKILHSHPEWVEEFANADDDITKESVIVRIEQVFLDEKLSAAA